MNSPTRLPVAEFRLLPDAAHMSPFVDPARFAALSPVGTAPDLRGAEIRLKLLFRDRLPSFTSAERSQVAGDAADRLRQRVDIRQGHQSKVVRRKPIEAGAVGDEDLLVPQEPQNERLVVHDRVHLGIQSGKAVQRAPWLHAAHSGNLVQQLGSKRTLLVDVWQQADGGSDRTVDVHLSWLRRKLGETAAEPRYLESVRGVGVRLVDPTRQRDLKTS